MSNEARTGLYGKYLVYPAEAWGKWCDFRPATDVFVLRPSGDFAARQALATYADSTEDTELSRDLWRWLAQIEKKGSA